MPVIFPKSKFHIQGPKWEDILKAKVQPKFVSQYNYQSQYNLTSVSSFELVAT